MRQFTIGQFAKAAGVPTSTIRYYERSGLLKPDFRTGSNYRGYGDSALQRLRFIRSAQTTGFSLAGVAELLRLTDSEDSPCDQVNSLLKQRLGEIRNRMKSLRQMQQTLSKSLRECCRGGEPDLCGELSRLQGDRSRKKIPASA